MRAILPWWKVPMGLFDWLKPRRPERRSVSETTTAKLDQLMLKDRELEVRERELKVRTIERVAADADPIEALEIISLATHRGKGQPLVVPRRRKDSSPLEDMAMRLVEERITADPMDRLDKILESRERLEGAADRFSGKRKRGDGSGGFLDALAAVADTELGRAIGTSLGPALLAGRAPVPPQLATPPPIVESPAPPLDRPAEAPAVAGPAVVVSAEPAGPIPLEVQIAVQHMRQMQPADAAEWILDHAKRNPALAQLVAQFVNAEPEQIPAFLQQAAASPAIGQWLPVVRHLADNPWWTMALHARMDELLADEEPAAPEAAAK